MAVLEIREAGAWRLMLTALTPEAQDEGSVVLMIGARPVISMVQTAFFRSVNIAMYTMTSGCCPVAQPIRLSLTAIAMGMLHWTTRRREKVSIERQTKVFEPYTEQQSVCEHGRLSGGFRMPPTCV